MKILNIFKKKQKSEVKSATVQKLEKTKLEKIVGGGNGKGVIVGDGGVGY